MKKMIACLFAVLMVSGLGQASAQVYSTVPQDYHQASAGFNFGNGVSAWTSVAGSNGYAQMNFGPGNAPLVDSYASNSYGNASVYARPWATGTVYSGEGGSGNISVSFLGGANAGVQYSKEYGHNTFSSVSKSVSMSVSSSGNGSANVTGGFDVSVGANGFMPPIFVPPAVIPTVPTTPAPEKG